jgi:uncharacterized Tic20 family protein
MKPNTLIDTGGERLRYVYAVIGRLIFAAITCLIVAIIAGGQEFLSQPLGQVYLALLLLWMATIAIGRKTGERSAYDTSQNRIYALLGVIYSAIIFAVPWEYSSVPGRSGSCAASTPPVSEIASVLGMSLALSSLIGLAMTILLFPLLIWRIRAEEGMLLAQFGEDYREYMQRTKQLIPGIY